MSDATAPVANAPAATAADPLADAAVTAGRRAALLLAAGLLTGAVVLGAGVSDELILDDFENLAPIHRYVQGETTWHEAVFGNRSGPLGRPLAMASFVANAILTGADPVALKVTNIALHLVTALLVALLGMRLLALDAHWRSRAAIAGATLGVMWLVLPIHVSTVLYVVQRMAQLSALLTVVALLAYVAARRRLASEPDYKAQLLLWLGVPLATVAAALAKETGALVPAYAFVIEVTLFATLARPRSVVLFFAVFLLLPAAVALAWLWREPALLVSGYTGRDFTLTERLLTEPRVLFDYVSAILLPRGAQMGLIHDDYVVSTGLLQPPATLAALLGWLLVVAAAFLSRRRAPLLACGIGWFLVGHALEATVFPLELYFEHRNYLPAFGVLLALTGIAGWAIARLRSPTPGFSRLLAITPLLVVAAYALVTHGRARVWACDECVLEQSFAANPKSSRLNSMLAAHAMQRGDLALALSHIERARAGMRHPDTARVALWQLLAYCETRTAPAPELVRALRDAPSVYINLTTMRAFELVADRAANGDCPGVDGATLARDALAWAERAPQSDATAGKWRVRFAAARLLGSAEAWPEAIAAAERAWVDSGYNLGVGVVVFQLNASAGRIERLREVHARLAAQADGRDIAFARAVAQFGAYLDQQAQPAREQGESGG